MKPIRFLPKIQRGKECLNCGLPLAGEENFCPNCGQRNDIRKLNFGSFLSAIFDEFISYDSRFWRTIIVLLLKPGKVSKDYIEGRRAQYANPFRFYLTISIIFFLLLGAYNKYDDFKKNGFSTTQILNIDTKKKKPKKTTQVSTTQVKSDSVTKNKKTDVLKIVLDSLSVKDKTLSIPQKISKYALFYRKHPDIQVDEALDSLKQPLTFWNRFYYSKTIEGFKIGNSDHGKSLTKKIIPNLSVALFIFLPLFTLFLKLFYIRRSFNYMEHLVFVFNTQAVFFLLMILLLGVNFFTQNKSVAIIFVILFLIYLYIALLKFYKQGWFKTLVKFSIFNWIYLTISGIGLSIVSVLAFLVG